MDGLITRIDTVFLGAPDLSAAVEWYRRVFGFGVIHRSDDGRDVGLALPEPGGGGRQGTGLTLYKCAAIDPDAQFGFNFFSADPEALHERLANEGLELTEMKTGGGMTFFEVRDISGNWVGECHSPHPAAGQ